MGQTLSLSDPAEPSLSIFCTGSLRKGEQFRGTYLVQPSRNESGKESSVSLAVSNLNKLDLQNDLFVQTQLVEEGTVAWEECHKKVMVGLKVCMSAVKLL